MESYEKKHYDIVRKVSPECMVLLKSDGTLPLDRPCKVALFGKGARQTLKGGTGSGDVYVKSFTTIEQGLINAEFTITSNNWLDAYDKVYTDNLEKRKAKLKEIAATSDIKTIAKHLNEPVLEPAYDIPLDCEGDIAIYVVARNSGEGGDRQVVEGDLKLTETEIRDILRLAGKFQRFLLVLNVVGVVDLSPVVDKVNNILLLSQLGIAIGEAFTDILLGKSYPSGKITCTWAAWEDYCKIGDFGEPFDTRYREGIYVGYRYFDTVGKAPIFPFGYGLSYTTFSIEAGEPALSGSMVSLPVTVKNTGSFRGKEVVQLYVSVPSKELDQPYQALAAYKKTKELMPGEEEILTISFDMADLKSFDYRNSSRILEQGDYILRVGNSSRNTLVAGVISLSERVIEKVSHVGGAPDFEDWKPEKIEYKDDLEKVPVLKLSASQFKKEKIIKHEIDEKALAFAKMLTNEELALLCKGGYFNEGNEGSDIPKGEKVPGAVGMTTDMLCEKGVPCLIMSDGPAGLRLSQQYIDSEYGKFQAEMENTKFLREILPEATFNLLLTFFPQAVPKVTGTIREQNCTAIPVGTAIAQSWNVDICRELGDIIGDEMVRFGVHIWLAPALNIQRNPLCGRNFEYYSEDPYLSGKMAAGFAQAVQRHKGCAVTLKHFCCNNQETNRTNSNSQVNERALRDIYLRGFEIAVKEGQPLAIMTSYNLLNGEHTQHRPDLVQTVLREEWGYKGIVMSDWLTTAKEPEPDQKYQKACASGTIKAGVDIMMPGSKTEYEDLLHALNNKEAKYSITRQDLESCAARIIELSWKLYEEREGRQYRKTC